MYIQSFKNLIKSFSLNQAKAARLAGVSRATVTKWLANEKRGGWSNVETDSLRNLAQALGLSPHVFLEKREPLSPHRTAFLWDSLYPDMESFVKALAEFHSPAVARLVQVLGFEKSRRILGRKAVTKFAKYKKFLKPARRHQLEILWPLYVSLK